MAIFRDTSTETEPESAKNTLSKPLGVKLISFSHKSIAGLCVRPPNIKCDTLSI